MSGLTRESVVVASREQVSSRLGDEAVILSLKTDVYFGLNEIGAFIWERLQQPRKVDELCRAIQDAYDVAPEMCERDLLGLLGELAEKGLIEIVDDAEA